jgi:hypothetical protein
VQNRKLIAASVLVLLVAGSIELWPRSEPSVVGTLSARDVAAISRIVRAEMWREVLPNLSWAAIRDLPSSIRRRWSERILSINIWRDGSVEVSTGVVDGSPFGIVNNYVLKKRSKGWEIMSRSHKGPSLLDSPPLVGAQFGSFWCW